MVCRRFKPPKMLEDAAEAYRSPSLTHTREAPLSLPRFDRPDRIGQPMCTMISINVPTGVPDSHGYSLQTIGSAAETIRIVTAGIPAFCTGEKGPNTRRTRIPFVPFQSTTGQKVSFQPESRPKGNLALRLSALWHAFWPVRNAEMPAVSPTDGLTSLENGTTRVDQGRTPRARQGREPATDVLSASNADSVAVGMRN